MTVRVGINGYGRIGRSFHRAILARGRDAGVELVAVNDPFGDSETMAFLLKHDSVGGTLHHEVVAGGDGVLVGAGRGAVRLGQVQPAGKRMLPAADWARGARPAAGERLGA